MADTRIGGQTPQVPLPTTTDASETTSEISQSIPNQQISTEIHESPKTATALKMQATESKGQHNLSGQLIRQNLNQALPTGGVAPIHSGSPQPAIRDLQVSINKWRVENGQQQIKEDGVFSPDTQNAIREFQRENGIKEDGIAGHETLKKLSTQVDIIGLKNDPQTAADMRRLLGSEGFTKLPSDAQSDVISRMKKYAAAGELRNIGNMVSVIDQRGFNDLPLSSRKLLLNTMAARPDDDRLAVNLSNMAATDFAKLDERSQNWVLQKIQSYGGDRTKITSLIIIANQTTPPPPDQPQGGPHKNELLTRLMKYPPDTDQSENMVKLLAAPGFRELPVDVRDQILDGLPYRFNSGQMTLNDATNLMTVATAPNFEKLHPDKREAMMNLLVNRPGNAELAQALRELAADKRFEVDKRTWRQTLDKLEASIHY